MRRRPEDPRGRGADADDKHWTIGTDSSRLIKAMTEQFPKWRRNNDKDEEGNEPANLDLFQTLHAAIVDEEAKQRVKIGFWKIPRARNVEATGLAKKAARSKFTPEDLAEIAKKLRADKQKAAANAVLSGKINATTEHLAEPKVSTSVDAANTKKIPTPKIEKKPAEPKAFIWTSKDVESKKTPLEPKTSNTKIVGTGPVSFHASLHALQGTSILITAEIHRGAHGQTPPFDLMFTKLDDELFIYP